MTPTHDRHTICSSLQELLLLPLLSVCESRFRWIWPMSSQVVRVELRHHNCMWTISPEKLGVSLYLRWYQQRIVVDVWGGQSRGSLPGDLGSRRPPASIRGWITDCSASSYLQGKGSQLLIGFCKPLMNSHSERKIFFVGRILRHFNFMCLCKVSKGIIEEKRGFWIRH